MTELRFRYGGPSKRPASPFIFTSGAYLLSMSSNASSYPYVEQRDARHRGNDDLYNDVTPQL